MPGGRPTDFTPALGEEILQLMASGLSLAAAAAELGVHRQRVYAWEAKHPEFGDTIKLARVKRQLFLERRLLSADSGPVVTSTIFALKNAAGEDWRDVVRQEHTGAGGGPVQTQAIPLDSIIAQLSAATGASEDAALRLLAAQETAH